MTRSHFFRTAAWVGSAERDRNTFSVLRGRFTVASAQRVTLNVLGLGFFKCNKEKEPIREIPGQTAEEIAKLKASFKNGESVRYRLIGSMANEIDTKNKKKS